MGWSRDSSLLMLSLPFLHFNILKNPSFHWYSGLLFKLNTSFDVHIEPCLIQGTFLFSVELARQLGIQNSSFDRSWEEGFPCVKQMAIGLASLYHWCSRQDRRPCGKIQKWLGREGKGIVVKGLEDRKKEVENNQSKAGYIFRVIC